jgi:hypothetical protein
MWEEIEKSSASQEEKGVHLLKVKKEVNYLLFRQREGEAL